MSCVELSIIRSSKDLWSLEHEWDALIARCPGYYLSQTFTWAKTAVERIALPADHRLICPILRKDGRLIAIWPMVEYRRNRLRTVRPLGSESSEYSSPLIEMDADAFAISTQLWRAIAAEGDFVLLPFVRADSSLSKVLPRAGLCRTAENSGPAPYIARSDFADWEVYRRSWSSFLRNKMRRMAARLNQHGAFTLEQEDPQNAAELIDWIIERKKRVLQRDQVTGDWIGRSDYRDFWISLATNGGRNVVMLALKLDGKILAAQVCTVDQQRVEGFLSGFDPAWAHCSPGHLLVEYAAHWAFERGLDLDTRIGDEPYKRDWTRRSCDTTTWYIATGWAGVPTVVRRAFSLWKTNMRTRLSQVRRRLMTRALKIRLTGARPSGSASARRNRTDTGGPHS
jgi:CelD/BcsL family acetyltransferase involved in cellulose biosynthesis